MWASASARRHYPTALLCTWTVAYAARSPILPLPSQVNSQAQFNQIFNSVVKGIEADAVVLPLEASALSAFLGQLAPTTKPSSIAQALASLEIVVSADNDHSILTNAAGLILNGLSLGNTKSFIKGYSKYNDHNNVNIVEPSQPVYPSAAAGDAPHSQSEDTLRRAICIPETFDHGANGRMPLLMVPGTATPGGINWIGNYYKLLKDSPLVDPVWLNIPLETQIDIQVSAEYVSYAAHYLKGISQTNNVTIMTWSQGGTDTQRALKYWPSLRNFVPDVVPFSPDYDGTFFGDMQCLSFPHLPCLPGARQQRPDSDLIAHLHANDGASAYVPTTTVYSIFDEIVRLQAAPIASALIEDARGVGASNRELQKVCRDQPAGGFYTHGGVLYDSMGYALFHDAITDDGPASLDRIDVTEVCSHAVTPGLGLAHVLATEGIIPAAALFILNATNLSPAQRAEPTIMPYALGA